MTTTQGDYILSADIPDIPDMLVPISELPEMLGKSKRTVERLIANLEKTPYTTTIPGRGPGKAVRLGDLMGALKHAQ